MANSKHCKNLNDLKLKKLVVCIQYIQEKRAVKEENNLRILIIGLTMYMYSF